MKSISRGWLAGSHLLLGATAFFLTLTGPANAQVGNFSTGSDTFYTPLFIPEFEARTGILEAPMAERFSEIRVKIFPHLKNYAPQGRDTRVSKTVLRSSGGSCRVFNASLNPPSKGGKLLREATVIPLSATELGNQLLWIECDSPATLERESGKTSYTYRGAFFVRKVGSHVEVTNVLSFEDYLKGVVPIEMPARWHPEALKAQAVAARTYAWFHVAIARALKNPRPWDVDDTVWYQAYTGMNHSAGSTDIAVERTAGQVMLHGGKIIQAFFSADSGGHTEDAAHVWGTSVPYCVAKPEIYEESDLDQKRWGPWYVKFSLGNLNRKLLAKGWVTRSNPAKAVWISDSNLHPSGRARSVTLQLRNGRLKEIGGNDFRRLFGLRSSLIRLSKLTSGSDPTYQIKGRGHGHGVGMSQIGAHTLASAMEYPHHGILNFYYSGIELCTFDPETATAEIPSCGF